MSTEDSGPRLTITKDDHAALIIVATATLLAWTVAVLTIRIASKLSAKIALGLEEAAIILSSVRSLAF
jgi:hypothetical protein